MYKASTCFIFTEKWQIPVGRIQQGSDEDPGELFFFLNSSEVLHPVLSDRRKAKFALAKKKKYIYI